MTDEIQADQIQNQVARPIEEVSADPNIEEKAVTKEDWRDKRISKLTAQKAELSAKYNQLEAQLAASQKGGNKTQTSDEDFINREINYRASVIASQNEFDRACNDIVEKGREKFNDFDSRVSNLAKLNDHTDANVSTRYVNFIQSIMETGSGENLIHKLGNNLDEASRLMNLSPIKLGIELAKIISKDNADTAAQQQAVNSITNAPRPITPVGQKGVSHIAISPSDNDRSDQLPTHEWMERRNAEVAEKQKIRRGF